MIYLDKLEKFTFKLTRNLQDSSPNGGGQFDGSSEKQEGQTKTQYVVLPVEPPDVKRGAAESPAHLSRKMPMPLSEFKGISLLGWNDLLFTCHLLQFVMTLLYRQCEHYGNLEDLFCWQRAIRKGDQNKYKIQKQRKIEQGMLSTGKKYICLVPWQDFYSYSISSK